MATDKSRTARKQNNKQKDKQKKPVWKRVFKAFLLFCLIIGLIGIGVFAYFIATAPKLDIDKLDVDYGFTFYDQDEEAFAELFEENRVKVEDDDIKDVLIDAIVATEDSRFFEHTGIDIRRIGGTN